MLGRPGVERFFWPRESVYMYGDIDTVLGRVYRDHGSGNRRRDKAGKEAW